MAHRLLEMALALLAYCKANEAFDTRQFGVMSKNFADTYKRATNAEQGEYHHLWHERMKGQEA